MVKTSGNRIPPRDTIKPVSYTHLDVYKRQQLRCTRKVLLRDFQDLRFHFKVGEIRLIFNISNSFEITHLQFIHRANTKFVITE